MISKKRIIQRNITTLILALIFCMAIGQICQSDEANTITIVSYNAKTHDSIKDVSWKQRLDNFINDVIMPYQPAIIGMQEIYLEGENGWASSEVATIGRKEYLRYLLDSIYDRTGKKYNVATALRVNYAMFGIGIAQEWEGNGVIYDPEQVRFIPFNEDNGKGRECENWAQDGLKENRNDCLPLSGKGSPKVSKSIFEFPKDSNNYILFYNIHCSTKLNDNNKQITEAVDFILKRHHNFSYNKYPPIFVGDFNIKTHPKFDTYFDDPIGNKQIDKILLGKADQWSSASGSFRYAPRRAPAWKVLDAEVLKERVYSDHPVVLAKVEAPLLNQLLKEECASFDPPNIILSYSKYGCQIVEGDKKLFSGNSPDEGMRVLQIIKHYNMNKSCYVSRKSHSFEYWLNSDKAPSGFLDKEDCLHIDTSKLVVENIAGYWQITDGTHKLLDFGDQYHEAIKTLDIIKKYGFTYNCYVGRPDASFKYFRK